MFKALLKKIQDRIAAANAPMPDPVELFGDPVAGEVVWGPCRSGGTNFRTRKLVQVDANRITFNPTLGARVFALIFMLGSLMWFMPFFLPMDSGDEFPLVGYVACTLGGLAFLGAGIWMWIRFNKPITFDKRAGYYWRGRQSPDLVFGGRPDSQKYVPLDEIYSLQIIREYCRSGGKNSRNYYSYELNLVLRDRSRVNVIDHGKYTALRRDAETLADYLDVPLWDLIGQA